MIIKECSGMYAEMDAGHLAQELRDNIDSLNKALETLKEKGITYEILTTDKHNNHPVTINSKDVHITTDELRGEKYYIVRFRGEREYYITVSKGGKTFANTISIRLLRRASPEFFTKMIESLVYSVEE